ILLKDRLVEVTQLAARLDAKLTDQRGAGRLVGVERLGLASRAVEREHQRQPQALAQRMLGHQRLELSDELDVVATLEVAVDPLLQAAQAQLLQARDLRLGEPLLGKIGERRTTPQRERLLEAALVTQLPEAGEVEVLRRDAQHVARRLRLQ